MRPARNLFPEDICHLSFYTVVLSALLIRYYFLFFQADEVITLRWA